MRPIAASLFALAIMASHASCATPTAIRIDVYSEVPCSKNAEVAIATATSSKGLLSAATGAVSTRCDDLGDGTFHRGSIVLTPQSDDSKLVVFQVATRVDGQPTDTCSKDATSCIVARRELRFQPHTTVDLRVDLRVSCAGVVCGGDQTCSIGACVSDVVSCAASSCDLLANDKYRAAVMADGPVGYWRFGDATATVAQDEIGNKHPGTYMGNCQVGVPGIVGSNTALLVDDSSCWVDLKDSFPFIGTAPFSLEAWIKPSAPTTTARRIFNRDTLTGADEGYTLYYGTDFLLLSRSVGGHEQGYAGTGPLAVGTFTYVVATYDGTTDSLYVNGTLAASGPGGGSIGAGAGDLAIGQLARGNYFKTAGVLDEIAIYDKALSPAQIQAHFAAAK